jgi:hypothetical protein
MLRQGKSSSSNGSAFQEAEKLIPVDQTGYDDDDDGQRYIDILEEEGEDYEEGYDGQNHSPPAYVHQINSAGMSRLSPPTTDKKDRKFCGPKWKRPCFPNVRSWGGGGGGGGGAPSEEHPVFLSPGGGLHYSYVLVMALLFSTLVQLSRGGLLAYEQKKHDDSSSHNMHPNYTGHGFNNIRGSNNLNSNYYDKWGNGLAAQNLVNTGSNNMMASNGAGNGNGMMNGNANNQYPGHNNNIMNGQGNNQYPGQNNNMMNGQGNNQYPGQNNNMMNGQGNNQYPGQNNNLMNGQGNVMIQQGGQMQGQGQMQQQQGDQTQYIADPGMQVGGMQGQQTMQTYPSSMQQQSEPDMSISVAPDQQQSPPVPETPLASFQAVPEPATPQQQFEPVAPIVVESPLVVETPPAMETPPEPATLDATTLVADPVAAAPVDPNDSLRGLSNFKDSWEPWDPSDVPVFFHIPKAGGSTIKDVMGTCHRFVMASEAGVTDGHIEDTEVAIVYPRVGVPGASLSPFVNIDATTIAGIERAVKMGFAESGIGDAVVTPFIYQSNDLFTPKAKGRLFTVFRHPIERAISLFYYLQVADWEPTYDPVLKDWTLDQYATSDKIENNWLTRQLSNQLGGELSQEHLNIAMEAIRRKFLVGLMPKMEETMTRLERFFRWSYHVNPANQEICRTDLLSGGSNSNSKNKKGDKPKEGDEVWDLLAAQNQFDLQLYGYIEALFDEQEQFVADVPVDQRNVGATCCKCDPATFPPDGFECPPAITEE